MCGGREENSWQKPAQFSNNGKQSYLCITSSSYGCLRRVSRGKNKHALPQTKHGLPTEYAGRMPFASEFTQAAMAGSIIEILARAIVLVFSSSGQRNATPWLA
jgi:hypothetical protein